MANQGVLPFGPSAVRVPRGVGSTAEYGTTGLKHWNGVLEDEFLRELRGVRGVKVYREMSHNDAVVGASLFAYVTLSKEVTFRVDSAKPGEAKADEVAEFVRGCLFEDMNLPWRDLLAEIMSFLPYGWSYFEIVYKQRQGEQRNPTKKSRFTDNKIGWRKWGVRSQETLERWMIDDVGGVDGMVQRAAPLYELTELPIEKCLLFRTMNENGSPEGRSILRSAYLAWYYKRRLQVIRGIGMERDLAGLPMLTPPQGVDIWNTNDPNSVILRRNAEQIVKNIRRDEHEGLVKPFGWELELLSSAGTRQFDISLVTAQLNQEIAMSMMTDFLLVGHEKAGARSLATDKRQVFSHAAASFLDGVCDVVNRFAIPKLVKLNGWPAELSPKLARGPVAEIGLNELTDFVTKNAREGLIIPDNALENHLRTRGLLPPVDEAGRAGRPMARETSQGERPRAPGVKDGEPKPTPAPEPAPVPAAE